MLYTISWMVTNDRDRARRRSQFEILTFFLAGGLTGGVVMGAAIAFPAWLLFKATGSLLAGFAIAAAVVAAVYAGRAAGIWPAPKPQFPHQVPEAWRKVFEPRLASFIYAGGLGTIYFTRLASFTAYPLLLLLIGMGRTPLAIIEVMAVAGLVRASTALAVPFYRLDRASSDAVLDLMEKHTAKLRTSEATVLLAIATLLAAGVLANHFG